ncbi:TrbI/VirB10 family protein [Sphingomonas naasensis]|uniref:TrbI/VirB10 family protein n=1 Tax=Sphingomonas naasensis TaxID=1344951 RepID=UPI001F0FB393|nr:TrbI/VirB10 family protein [Sphingomonas naasensis]
MDPESLAIRSRPPRAIRFRRGLIVAISAAGSVSLIAVAWKALGPSAFRQVAQESQLSQPSGKRAPDGLNGLPASYGDVPKLGPPLPGDLGRPILERQRQLAAEGVSAPADIAAQAAEAEHEQQLAERKAARESGLLVSRAQGDRPAPATAAATASSEDAAPPREPIDRIGLTARPSETGLVGPDGQGVINPHSMAVAASPHILSAGSVIAASLITGVRSDLPGMVVAQVTERVYDSPTGRTLLIPQGARLIGTYDSVVAFGQKRALIVWQRILLPDGGSLSLDKVPATDPSGYAGLEDKVDFHTWRLIKGVVLSTLLGVGSELAFTSDSDLVEAMRRSTQDNVARAGDQITQRNLNIQPTITIRPGAPVRLIVNKDLILAPWKEKL